MGVRSDGKMVPRRSTAIGRMNRRASFENAKTLNNFLAGQLRSGSLAVFLGAGVSVGYDLPGWAELVDRCFRSAGIPKPADDSLDAEELAEELLMRGCGGQDEALADLVRSALFEGVDLSFDALRKNGLLASLGALTMPSMRGSVPSVVSFNFDDLLETYLRYYGASVESVGELPCWQRSADVTVLHPHGLLPADPAASPSKGIVFAQLHYDRVVGSSASAWRARLLDIMCSSTCLFLGLSGSDKNLTSLLAAANKAHASAERKDAFWGVRISDSDSDPRRGLFEKRGVFQVTLRSYDDLPQWLFSICQEAALGNA